MTKFTVPSSQPPKGALITGRELAEDIAGMEGYTGKFMQGTFKPDGKMRKVPDVSKFPGLGWKAKAGLKEGIALTRHKYCESQR
jgi:GDP-L-fucose synthase